MLCLSLVVLYASDICASPWVPLKGSFEYIASLYYVDSASIHRSIKESSIFYQTEVLLSNLSKQKQLYITSPKITEEAKDHRVIEIDNKIQSIKNIQSRIRKNFDILVLSQYIEYGIMRDLSIIAHITQKKMLNFSNHKHDIIDIDVRAKVKMLENRYGILSIKPGIIIEDIQKDAKMHGVFGFAVGRSDVYKYGKCFYYVEITPYFGSKSTNLRLEYTSAVEFKNGISVLLQNYIDIKSDKLRSFGSINTEQLSLLKHFSGEAYERFTIQIGYFNKYSKKARRSLSSGAQCAIWLRL